MFLADNDTARGYDTLQRGIDWEKSSNQEQHDAMKKLLAYLYTQPMHIPIYYYGTKTGVGTPATVQSCIYITKDRVDRYIRNLNKI